MPRKARILEEKKWQGDRRVPIRGDRVRAALEWRGFANREASRRLDDRGVRITPQGLDNITSERTKKCRQSVRSALARLCGPPITAKYLGGEAELRMPAMPVSPNSLNFRAPPSDMLGTAHPGFIDPIVPKSMAREEDPPFPARYELEATRLAAVLGAGWHRQHGTLMSSDVALDLFDGARLLLSLPFWRKWLHQMGELGSPRPSLRTAALGQPTIVDESDAFATAMGTALKVLLRPWVVGRAKARTELLHSVAMGLRIGLESETLRYWGEVGNAIAAGTMRMTPTDDGGALLEQVKPSK